MVRFLTHLRQKISRKVPSLTFGGKVTNIRYDWIQLRKTALNAKEEIKQGALGKLDAMETDMKTLEEEHLGRISKRGDIRKRVVQGLEEVRQLLAGVPGGAPSIFNPANRWNRRIYFLRDDWGTLRLKALGLGKDEAGGILEKLDTLEDDLSSLEKGVGRLQRGDIHKRVEEGLKDVKNMMKGKVAPEAKPPETKPGEAVPPGKPGEPVPQVPTAPTVGAVTKPAARPGTTPPPMESKNVVSLKNALENARTRGQVIAMGQIRDKAAQLAMQVKDMREAEALRNIQATAHRYILEAAKKGTGREEKNAA